jgi:hypothetical protein
LSDAVEFDLPVVPWDRWGASNGIGDRQGIGSGTSVSSGRFFLLRAPDAALTPQTQKLRIAVADSPAIPGLRPGTPDAAS